MSIQAYWPLSPYLTLSTGTNIGYQYFSEGEGRNGLTIGGVNENATSRFGVDFSLSNDAIITFSNSFSANIASVSIQTNDGQNNARRQDQPFRRFNSISSLRYAQRLTPQTRASCGYSLRNTFAREITTNNGTDNMGADSSIDNQTHRFFTELGTQLNDSLTLSLLGNFSSTIYTEEFRNDSRQYQSGPRITYISEAGLNASVSMLVNQLEFDNTNSPDTRENKSTFLNVEGSISFSMGNFLTHNLRLNSEKRSSLATISNPQDPTQTIPANSQEETSFTYRFSYLLAERSRFSLSYQLSQIKESDSGNQYSRQTITVDLPFQFQLNTRTTVSTLYNYSQFSGSEFAEFNYDQHRIEVNFQLNF